MTIQLSLCANNSLPVVDSFLNYANQDKLIFLQSRLKN